MLERDRCKDCGGKKTKRQKKILEVRIEPMYTVNYERYTHNKLYHSCIQVHVEKGMKDGQKITFYGEGDQVYHNHAE